MIRNIAIAAGFLTAMVAPAFADCSEDMTKIAKALETAQISDADKEMVKRSLAEANAKISDEDACQEAISDAKTMVGVAQ